MFTQTMTGYERFKKPAAGLPVGSGSLAWQIEMMGAVMPFARGGEIFGENERAECLFKVVTGSVRTYRILEDGRRQVDAFYLPGDIFGFEVGDEHTLFAEAIVESKVLVVKRSSLVALAARDGDMARQLWDMMARELQRAREHMMLLIKTAQERVVGFLLEMSKRSPAGNGINLQMSRQDIADHLGLTIETVSRTLTQLESASAIAVPSSRHIVLRNRSALNRLNS